MEAWYHEVRGHQKGVTMVMVMILLLALGCSSAHLGAETASGAALLTFFVRPYAELQRIVADYQLQELITLPGGVERESLKRASKLRCFRGIYATYTGQVDHSNCDGQITFALRHPQPVVTLVIADHIYPLLYPGITAQHLEVESPEKAAYYRYELVNSDLLGGMVWRVSRLETPKTSRIPLDAVVLFMRPEDIYVVEGDYAVGKGHNYVLPDVYVMPEATVPIEALRILNTNYLMAPVRGTTKRDAARIARVI